MSAVTPIDLLMPDLEAAKSPDAPTDSTISVSPGLPDWLARHGLTLAVTCYQSSQLFLAGTTPAGKVAFSFQAFGKAMGIAYKNNSLYLAAMYQLWRIENILRPGEISGGMHDAVLLPRVGYTIGDLDMHEIGITFDGKPLIVNTRYNCLCTLDPVHAFRPVWKPFFISEIAQGDRCHLNGLAMDKGRARYVTALGQADEQAGWKAAPDRGLLMEVERNRIVRDDLYMPHSPRLMSGQLYLLESGRGFLVRLDLKSGGKTDVCFLPGFVRGLSFHGDFAFVTLSKPRQSDIARVPLADETARRGLEPWCGVAIVDLKAGEIVEWIRFEGKINQLFDVLPLPGVRCARLLGPMSAEMANAISFDLSALPNAAPGRR